MHKKVMRELTTNFFIFIISFMVIFLTAATGNAGYDPFSFILSGTVSLVIFLFLVNIMIDLKRIAINLEEKNFD